MSEFHLHEEAVDERTQVIAVSGEIDRLASPRIHRALESAIDAGKRHIVIDLSDARYVDSSAISALIRGAKRLGEEEGRLAVACSHTGIAESLNVKGVDTLIDITPTREDALALLG